MLKSNQKIGIIGGAITAAIIIAVIITSANVSQQTNSPSVTSTKLKVIASFFPMYEFVRNVAGNKADVSVFIPIGEEPHGWEPSTQAIQDVSLHEISDSRGSCR